MIYQAIRTQVRLAFGITRPPEFSGDLVRVNLFPDAHRFRNCVDFGRVAEHRSAESLINDAAVRDVVIRENANHSSRHDKKHQ